MFKKYSQLKHQANTEEDTLEEFALGKLSLSDVKERGVSIYSIVGKSLDKWEELPSPLYHVTTAKSKVLSEGLKTRRELGQRDGKGLGGGPSTFISFTESLKVGREIKTAMLEARKVARKELSVSEMLEMARKGTGAKRPWIADLEFYFRGGKPGKGMSRAIQLLAEGYDLQWIMGFLTELPGWEPDPQSKPYMEAADGIPRYNLWIQPLSPEKEREYTFDFYKVWCSYRENAGGPMDPWFFSSDSEGLANTPEEEIALLEFKPIPGARGFKVSALGEWRTSTGKAVVLSREVA